MLIIFRHIYIMGRKSCTELERFFLTFSPIEKIQMSESPNESFDFENVSSSTFRKFAIECNWNSKISQECLKVLFIWKKTWFFFKIGKGGKLAVKYVSNNVFFSGNFFPP